MGHPKGYFLPGGARIFHMMLMSWAGERYEDAREDVPDIDTREDQSVADVNREGVLHGDLHPPDLFWNEGCQRVFIVDFDRAVISALVKHKRVSVLSKSGGKSKKRKRKGDKTGKPGFKRS